MNDYTMKIYIFLFIIVSLEFFKHVYPYEYNIIQRHVSSKVNTLNDKLKPIISETIYKIIYLYSYCEIQMNKFKIIIMPYLNLICISVNNYLIQNSIIQSPPQIPKYTLEIYELGEYIKSIQLYDEGFNFERITNSELKYDFFILSDNHSNMNCVNKINYYDFPNSFNYTLSSIKFLSIELCYDNKIYTIELKTDYYNHYIVNNILDKHFFYYYLSNILKIPIDINLHQFDYKVNIIDHNVNMVELTNKHKLIFGYNDYTIQEIDSSINVDNLENSNNSDNAEVKEEKDDSDDFIKL